jgi:hypothetical protein
MLSSSCSGKADLFGKVFVGETSDGREPSGSDNKRLLMTTEGINPNATIGRVRVYAGNLDGVPTITHFYFAHWWVVFVDSDGHWWSAENVGAPLLQRVDDRHDGKYFRKDVGKTQVKPRATGIEITTKMNTLGKKRRTMRELVDWLDGRSCHRYDVAFDNCQDFGADLCEFLTGIGVLHTSTKTTTIGMMACVPLAPLWKIGNLIRGALN